MFEFFTKRWISRKEFDEKVEEAESWEKKAQVEMKRVEILDKQYWKLKELEEEQAAKIREQVEEIKAFQDTLVRTRVELEKSVIARLKLETEIKDLKQALRIAKAKNTRLQNKLKGEQ